MLIQRITALTDGELAWFGLDALIAFVTLKPHIYAYNIYQTREQFVRVFACVHMCAYSSVNTR